MKCPASAGLIPSHFIIDSPGWSGAAHSIVRVVRMGDLPAQIKIVCPGCNTQFRLKLKKGRLAKGAIPCPRCGEDIPVVEANLRPDTKKKDASTPSTRAPETHIFGRTPFRGPAPNLDSPRPRSGTAAGAPRLSTRSTPPDDEDDFSHLEVTPGLSHSDPRSTFLGMGAGLMAIDAQAEQPGFDTEDRTANVDESVLEQIRSSVSSPEFDPPGFDQESATKTNTKPLSKESSPESFLSGAETAERDVLDPQTLKDTGVFKTREKTKKASTPERLARESETEAIDPPFAPDPDPTSEVPKQMVLGRIKIKQKFQQKLEKDASTSSVSKPDAQDALPESSDTKPTSERTKSSLATLLKKARDRKIELPAPSERSSDRISTATKTAPRSKSAADLARRKSAAALDRALNSLADETARALDKTKGSGTTRMLALPVSADREAPAYDTGDSSMIDLLRRRVAENQQPGAASERRGSGYIRLPTAEIQDVLGHGTYRLRVEDIIYEPIDKAGLTELVKRGVLMGAAEIAQSDGDWMPLGEHPVLAELRQKMAIEAHEMLSTLKRSPEKSDKKGASDSSAQAGDWPKPSNRPGYGGYDSSADDFADLKDSTEFAAISSLTSPIAGDSDFDTANSGLFADVDALRGTTKRTTTKKMFSTADISLEAPSSAKPAESAPQELPVQPEAIESKKEEARPEAAPRDESHAVEPGHDAIADDGIHGPRGDQPDDLFESLEPSKSTGTTKRIFVLLAMLLAVAGLALLSPVGKPYLEQIRDRFSSNGAAKTDKIATGGVATKRDEPKSPERAKALAPAIDAAQTEINNAARVDLDTPKSQEKLAEQLTADGEHATAAEMMGVLWEERRDDADFAARYYNALIDSQQYGAAGTVAIQSMLIADAQGSTKSAREFEALFHQAVEKNPELGAYRTVDIDVETHADAAQLTLKGKKKNRLAFALTKDQNPTFVFKPSQAQFERDWRMGIASWRLCEIMVCNFDIPRARPARVERAVFEKLIAGDSSASAEKLAALRWVREDGQEFLYGALVDAVDSPARFPIEYLSLWRSWLAPGHADDLKIPLAEGLAVLKNLEDDFYNPLLAQANEITLSQLAGQLSSVLLFDYLTNNWDRFHADSALWGTHLGLRNGVLVSTENLSTFQPRSSTRIKGRFEWSSRFSQATVASLRLMKPEVVSALLFPSPSASERARVDLFWSQRDLALSRIDSLVEARGQKEALRFD